MNPPDLRALRRGDPEAWDEAFRWLWPVAFAVAELKLGPFLPGDLEDVAIETLEEIVDKVREVDRVEDLKPLTASIAHNRSVSLLRERFAKKRGARQTESLDALQSDGIGLDVLAEGASPLSALEQTELGDLLAEIQSELKADQRALLSDFFLRGLSYEEIARKHGLAIGSVGVYLKRGLEAIRKLGARHPKLMKELEAFLR
jgi:RNA polymerase sigma factor (sigma-70 family)